MDSSSPPNPFHPSPRITPHPFAYGIALGNIANHDMVWIYGHNPAAASTDEVVCEQSGLITYLTNGATLGIQTTSTDDGTGSTGGAQKVTVMGCDTDYVFKAVEYTLGANGVGVTSSDKWYRPFYAEVTQSADESAPTGDITIANSGDSDQILLQIAIGEGVAHAAIYTVPLGHTLYITNWWGAEETNKGVAFSGYTRAPASDNEPWHNHIGMMTNAGVFTQTFVMPFPVAEKNDVQIRVTGAAVDGIVTAGMGGWLEH